MSEYPLPKNPIQAAWLQHLRDKNARIASVCKYCNNKSVGIKADGYKIVFVCKEHNDIS